MEGYTFDYRLGYVRAECAFSGFDIIGDDRAPNGRIVTLGGYTTPEIARTGMSWVHALYKKTGGRYQIYNGCTDGYSSAQILTMFIREAVLLKPKLVICFSGFYNIAYKLGFIKNKMDAELIKSHPFSTPGQLDFYNKITSRFGLGNDEVFFGTENSLSAWELWLYQMEQINCLCAEFNIEFKTLLQPCVFSGIYQINDRERSLICDSYKLSSEEVEKFRTRFQREYTLIKEGAKERDFFIDLSNVYDDCKDVYADASHVQDRFITALTENVL